MVVNLQDSTLMEYQSRARFNVPSHVRERAANVWALIIHAIGEQLAEYFQPAEYAVFEHGKGRFVGTACGDRYILLSMRRRASVAEVPALVARVKALSA
jgi:hypothetical protein